MAFKHNSDDILETIDKQFISQSEKNKLQSMNQEFYDKESVDLKFAKSTDVNAIMTSVENTNQIRVLNDISGSDIKAGYMYDCNYLKTIQCSNIASLMGKIKKSEPVTFTFMGDSLTYGHDISSSGEDIIEPDPSEILPDGSTHKYNRAKINFPEAFRDSLRIVYGNDKINIINRGYSGDYASKSLTRWNEKHNGDISFILLGTNDSRSTSCPYVGNVKEFIKFYEQLIIRELLWDKCVFLIKSPRTLHANDMRVQSFSTALDALAVKYNCPIVDINDFISSYHIDIWSDATVQNVNNIRTHLTSKGYSIIGKRLASYFIGDGILRPNKVVNGTTLLVREQVDGIKYINTALNLEIDTVTESGTPIVTYTPQERNVNKSFICRIGNNGKVIYNFYTEEDDLYVISTVYVYANKSFKMTLDFGIEQPRVNLTTKYIPRITNGTIIPNSIELSLPINKVYYKEIFMNDNIEPLRIAKRGWHSILIESNDCVLSGLEFISKSEFDIAKKIKNTFNVKTQPTVWHLNYDSKYVDVIGKVQIPMPQELNVLEITGIDPSIRIVNRQCTVTNKLSNSYCSIYYENGSNFIEVVNKGTLSEDRIAFVDFRLFGYFS